MQLSCIKAAPNVIEDTFKSMSARGNVGELISSYNALERRDACKGGKEVNKKAAPANTTMKGASAVAKNASVASARRVDHLVAVVPSIGGAKPSKAVLVAPSTGGRSVPFQNPLPASGAFISSNVASMTPSQFQVLNEQIIELKLSVDSLEKERDFCFAKLRDIEILCQNPDVEQFAVIAAIRRILYAADDNPTVIAEAQALIYKSLNPSNEKDENKARREINKRKPAGALEVEDACEALSLP